MINNKIIIIMCLILLILTTGVTAYYKSTEYIEISAKIAEPIIKVEPLQDTVKYEIGKNSEKKEYLFTIKNYENNKISEVDFEVKIEIKSNNNFPITYNLYDCSSNEEILNGNTKVEKLNVLKDEKFDKTYKLEVYCEDVNKVSGITEIEIEVEAIQK
jgi:hypothetical protein